LKVGEKYYLYLVGKNSIHFSRFLYGYLLFGVSLL